MLGLVVSLISVVLLVGLVVGLVYLGWVTAHNRLRHERQLLDAEWRALDDTRRIRAIFLTARRALQADASRRDTTRPPS